MERVNKKSFWSKLYSWVIRSSRVLFVDGQLMWLFFALLALAICIPTFFNLHFIEQVQISASILQISAFFMFIKRLNEIHIFYNNRSFLKSFQMWFHRLFRAPQPPIVKDGFFSVSEYTEPSVEELTKAHDKKLRKVEAKVKESERNTRELHLRNTGRELVAVIWLIIASFISSFPNCLQLLLLY